VVGVVELGGEEAYVVKLLLDAGADANECNALKGGPSVLHEAIAGGKTDIAIMLLESGALIKDRNDLKRAVKLNSAAVVRLMLRHKDTWCKYDIDSALDEAIRLGMVEAYTELIRNGAEINDYSLRKAVTSKNATLVKMLLDDHAGCTTKKSTSAALCEAAELGLLDIAETLVRRGAKVSEDVLFGAASSGNASLLEFLLNRRGNWSKARKGQVLGRVLGKAVEGDHLDACAVLIRHGADLSHQGIMESAVNLENLAILELLLQAGADGGKALLTAASQENLRAVSCFVKYGTDVNRCDQRDHFGMTALTIAAMLGNVAIVELLISGGALLDAGDCKLKTALMHAASKGHGEVVTRLLAAGADRELISRGEKTAEMKARRHGWTAIADLLHQRNLN
jgi:ankyrin repeat protein